MLKKKRSDLETQTIPSRFNMEKKMAKVTKQDNKTRARVCVAKRIPGDISIVDLQSIHGKGLFNFFFDRETYKAFCHHVQINLAKPRINHM